jgi:hypothetical protein
VTGLKLRPSQPTTIALLLSPIGLVLISATRLLIISNYNPATASTIVSSGSYVDTLLGTVIPLVPIFMPYLALALLFFNRVIASTLALLAALLVSPSQMTMTEVRNLAYQHLQSVLNWASGHLFGLYLLGVPLLILLAANLAGVGIYAFLKSVATIASLALIPFVFRVYPFPLNNNNDYYGALLRQPWLPPELIALKSGPHVVGYTLSADSDWFVVLLAGNRTVRYIRADEVASREVCEIGGRAASKPLVTFISTVPTVPMCGPPEKRKPSNSQSRQGIFCRAQLVTLHPCAQVKRPDHGA